MTTSHSSSSPLASSEELEEEKQQPQQVKECVHKTKTIQFLGRTTPIVLQNDNGPCPLLAICNVLLLRNNLNLSPDISEVSQEKLLSLVAERLIDSNSNVNNKDAGYVENQQQNIADAIDRLPRLATGIDVNIKFRRIDDFEFTPECAIFDLLDIPLYHGWIVDAQDFDTADAIGFKSYNALMGELVALETQKTEGEYKINSGEDYVDFAAATTATLGVPSPSLSKTRSFDDSQLTDSGNRKARKGDLEEEAELLRVLKLSETALPTQVDDSLVSSANTGTMPPAGSDEIQSTKKDVLVSPDERLSTKEDALVGTDNTLERHIDSETVCFLITDNSNQTCLKTNTEQEMSAVPAIDGGVYLDLSSCTKPREQGICDVVDKKNSCEALMVDKCSIQSTVGNITEMPVVVEDAPCISPDKGSASVNDNSVNKSQGDDKVEYQFTSVTGFHEPVENVCVYDTAEASGLSMSSGHLDSSGRLQHDVPEAFTSSIDGSEPIYEGEECIFDSGSMAYENREPVYEGEVILAEQADNIAASSSAARAKDGLTPEQGEVIRNFLKNNASQLTFYGLFCLQDGLKERELCVFFRNNHFSTMFKYDGELYLLATDQGYLNQPDLVWEKLNEVNGDTLFMTGNFKEFKVESQTTNDAWDEHNVVASTADYLASIDSAAQAGLDINSDLQLAIALQHQEFEQQPQRHNSQQPSNGSGSKLITGPQVSKMGGRNSSSSYSRPDGKSKEKCTVM